LRIAVGACSLVLTATTALAQDYDDQWRHARFTGIRTYSFQRTPPAAPDSKKHYLNCESAVVHEQTNAAIAAELERLGMTRDDDHPDIYVLTRRRFEVRYTYYGPYDTGWASNPSGGLTPKCHSGWAQLNGWHGWNGGVYADLYSTLTISLEDPATHALRWQGAQTKRIPSTLKPGERLNDQVTDIFKRVSGPGTVA